MSTILDTTYQTEIVRAISVRQPYAELIMLGLKKKEYRSIKQTLGKEFIFMHLIPLRKMKEV